MKNIGPDGIIELVKKFEVLRDKICDDKDVIERVYSGTLKKSDARITIYSKLINSCNSLQLALTHLAKNLLQKSWWKQNHQEDIPDKDILIYANEFQSFVKIAFIQMVFSSVESSLRIYLRKIAPHACNNGTAEFKSIYDCLFCSHLSVIPNEGIELLDLLRNVRNTIHNNGVYFHKSGNDSSITWKQHEYNFIYEVPISFVTWDFVVNIVANIAYLIFEITNDSAIKNIADEIKDPFAEDNR